MKKYTISTIIGALVLAVMLGGCSNPSTPAGYIGYIKQGAWVGTERFYGMQTGPSSTGLGWLLSVTNVSITPYAYHEPLEVLSRDNLQVRFQIHLVWRVQPTHAAVQAFIEKYTTISGQESADKIAEIAYANFLKDPLRTATRNEAQSLDALLLKERIVEIGRAVEAAMRIWAHDTPFDILSIVVGDIAYPAMVAEAVARKMSATQLLEQKLTEIEIEKREKDKRIIQAEGIAAAMEVIQRQLTDQYLQHEAIEAQKAMVGSPNHTTIYIPVGPMGVPLVSTIPQGK